MERKSRHAYISPILCPVLLPPTWATQSPTLAWTAQSYSATVVIQTGSSQGGTTG